MLTLITLAGARGFALYSCFGSCSKICLSLELEGGFETEMTGLLSLIHQFLHRAIANNDTPQTLPRSDSTGYSPAAASYTEIPFNKFISFERFYLPDRVNPP